MPNRRQSKISEKAQPTIRCENDKKKKKKKEQSRSIGDSRASGIPGVWRYEREKKNKKKNKKIRSDARIADR